MCQWHAAGRNSLNYGKFKGLKRIPSGFGKGNSRIENSYINSTEGSQYFSRKSTTTLIFSFSKSFCMREGGLK